MNNEPNNKIASVLEKHKNKCLKLNNLKAKRHERREEIAFKIALITEIINTRRENGLTQKQLETLSGVKQPVIARLECGNTDPQLSTLFKILAPMGKTLAIVPLDNK